MSGSWTASGAWPTARPKGSDSAPAPTRCSTTPTPSSSRTWSARPHRSSSSTGRSSRSAGNIPSFSRLQGGLGISEPERARRTGIAVYYYLFDIIHLEGYDTTRLPVRPRKRLLRGAVAFHGHVRFLPHRNRDGEKLFVDACRRGLEGLIAKRAESHYASKRSTDWLKLKCSHEQELVVGGFTAPQGKRTDFGALLVGYYEDGELSYAGKVGTGLRPADPVRPRRADAKARTTRSPLRRRPPDPEGHSLDRAASRRAIRLQRVDPRRPPPPPSISRAARRQAARGSGQRASAASCRS